MLDCDWLLKPAGPGPGPGPGPGRGPGSGPGPGPGLVSAGGQSVTHPGAG